MCRQRYSLESLFPGAEPEAIDLVRRLLVFNPDRRLTADESLRHPYVRRFHNPVSEMVVGHDIVPPVADNEQLTISEYRNRLYEVPRRSALLFLYCISSATEASTLRFQFLYSLFLAMTYR